MAGEYDKSKYTRKERLQNFWYYHKWYFIVGGLAVLFLLVQIHKLTTQPSIGFQSAFFNVICASMDDGDSYANAFGQSLGADPNQMVFDIQMNESFDITEEIDEVEYATVQQLSAYVANGDLDTAVADVSAFTFLAYWDCLADLRDFYTEEQLKEWEPYLYYVDATVVEARADTMWGTEEYNMPLPDPKDPDAMEEPIPVGIYIENPSESFSEEFVVANGTGIVGIFVTTQRAGVCKAFIDYIMD